MQDISTRTFTKNDSGFVCGHCGKTVIPLGYSSRNHCPFCLWSRHLDVNPGDRLSECGGLMEPVSAEPDAKKGYVITHRCVKCGAVRRNRAALSGEQSDDIRKIIRLTAQGKQ